MNRIPQHQAPEGRFCRRVEAKFIGPRLFVGAAERVVPSGFRTWFCPLLVFSLNPCGLHSPSMAAALVRASVVSCLHYQKGVHESVSLCPFLPPPRRLHGAARKSLSETQI